MATDDDGDVDGADGSGVAACTAVAIGTGTMGKGKGEVGRKGGAQGPKRLFGSRVHRVMRDFIYRREEERNGGVGRCVLNGTGLGAAPLPHLL